MTYGKLNRDKRYPRSPAGGARTYLGGVTVVKILGSWSVAGSAFYRVEFPDKSRRMILQAHVTLLSALELLAREGR